jgi:hypothetical protein
MADHITLADIMAKLDRIIALLEGTHSPEYFEALRKSQEMVANMDMAEEVARIIAEKEKAAGHWNALRIKPVITWDGRKADAEIHELEFCPNCQLHKSLSIQYVDTHKSLAEATCLKCGRTKSVKVRLKYNGE